MSVKKTFLSTLSLRRATNREKRKYPAQENFYPRSPCGERLGGNVRKINGISISIHALLAESDLIFPPVDTSSVSISIHALLAESDHNRGVNLLGFQHFYPRSPCGERQRYFTYFIGRLLFLSTLSLRRATFITLTAFYAFSNFYPRSPCGERQSSSYNAYLAENISIHALLAESDRGWTLNINGPMTISIHALLAESDKVKVVDPGFVNISIHALLAESDRGRQPASSQSSAFLSTLSLRRATQNPTQQRETQTFLSTLSLRRATQCSLKQVSECMIFLSTLSLRRATIAAINALGAQINFYPRSPCGERPIGQP